MTAPPYIIISSDSRRIPVPLEIVDDLIAEDTECVKLRLSRYSQYTSLYTIDYTMSTVDICIRDNDSEFGYIESVETLYSYK